MALKFHYPPGATPLDPGEAEGLIPAHITTQELLNAWELQNILKGERWARARKRKDILTLKFILELHRKMFERTWKWAGTPRTTGKNIGIDPFQITVDLKKLCEDVAYQIEHKTYSLDEIAARFHHRMIWIHPFPNGNGRHARLIPDVLLIANGARRFIWGKGDLVNEGDVRELYIQALHAADQRDYGPLLKFVRSGGQ